MHRLSSGSLLVTTVTLTIVLAGCLGKSTSNPGNGGVKTVSLNPAANVSIDIGGTQAFSATATDAQGHTVIGTITYVVSTPPGSTGPAPLSVTSAGNACAGTWDQSFSMCQAGTPGVALVTAVVNGVSSPRTTVYVHYHIDSLQAETFQKTPDPTSCYYQDPTCCSQGQTWIYQAVAYSNNQDITNTIGPVNWASTNNGVLTTDTNPPLQPPLPNNQVQITSSNPGITELFASVSGTTSNSIPVTSCLVQYVRLRASGSTTNSISVNNGSSVSLQASVVDTAGFTLPKPPLTWSTSNPEVVSFSTVTNTTGTNSATAHNNLGGATVTASCSPPTCNIGVLPGIPVPQAMPVYVYASDGPLSPFNPQQGYGAISVDVTTTGNLPTYSAWAATDQCQGAAGCTSTMFQITPSTTGGNPISATVTVPRTPNSMLFNFQTRVYMGSDQGLMYVDTGSSSTTASLVSSSPTPCNVSLCGTVLGISNDGKLVVVSDTVSSTPQVYIYDSSSGAVTDLVLSDVAKVAAFSPDQSKIFIVTNNGTMYVYSTVNALGVVPGSSSPTGATFSADGSFGYIATSTSPSSFSVNAFSMCALQNEPSVNLGNVATTALPVQLSLSPVTRVVTVGSDLFTEENVVVLEPPYVQVLTAQYLQTDVVDKQFTCNLPSPPPNQSLITAGAPYNLGQGNFTPVYSRLVANGTEMIVVGRHIPAVLIFSVSNGTTSSVPLVNSADPLSASSSSDGTTVYVAACDQYQPDGKTCAAGSVHVVDTITRGDFLQVPYINNSTNNMCNGLGQNAPLCIANMVAIKPQ